MRPATTTPIRVHCRHVLPLLLWSVAVLGFESMAGGTARAAENARPVPIQVRYDGTGWLEAHFKRPHEARPFHSKAIYSADGRGRLRLDWTTWADGDSAPTPETFLVRGDSVFHRDAPGATWQLLAGQRRQLARLQAAAGTAQELGRLVRDQTTTGRGEFMFDGQQFVYLEKHAHRRLGDVIDSVAYTYEGSEEGSDTLPAEILVVIHEDGSQWRLVQHPFGLPDSTVPDSLFRAPVVFDPPPAHGDSLVGEVKIDSLAPGLWAAEMEDIDSRSMFVEFADHLAVIEIAASSANGERVVDAARRKWPKKPIRYAFFSHHHPHYLGGLRAMIAEGATVVTTPGNQAYVNEIAAYPFTLEPDRLARAPKRVKVRTFRQRFELADSTNELVALNYGDRSQHTEEFVVFWFPRAKLLFEAELGWVRVDGKLRASRRAVPLLAWIAEQKLDVERLVQSWPMRDDDAEVSRAKLEELARAAKR